MPTYAKCEPKSGVDALVKQTIANQHQDLADCKVTIFCKFAYATRDKETGEPKGPAIKHNGYPALAVIRINPLEKRVEGLADATLTIDGDAWPTLQEDRREALIDHELTHLEVCRDEDGGVIGDDVGRPKLKIRLHDIVVGGFHEIVERHGYAAEEARAVQGAVQKWHEDKLIQGTFPFWG